MTELRRCPFCGGERKIKQVVSYPFDGCFYCITCKDCYASGTTKQKEDEAAEAWNKRVCE